jgi:putative endonuclease
VWLAANPDEMIRDIRFDAILVAPGKIPRHIPAAFETG